MEWRDMMHVVAHDIELVNKIWEGKTSNKRWKEDPNFKILKF